MRMLTAILLTALCLFTLETTVAQDVPHPALPAGAGKVDADAPKTFTKTASGLQYRVLRKGAGANPGRAAATGGAATHCPAIAPRNSSAVTCMPAPSVDSGGRAFAPPRWRPSVGAAEG